ncbi:hypothetical protein B0H14DRAFT_2780699 [Mycena olivaceomarginata]|nr:hypothetical protein B0H14DRAFT_2780699 [Mycena olivaceomarginata]
MTPLCPAASDSSSKASNPVSTGPLTPVRSDLLLATPKVNGQSNTNTVGGVKRTAKHNRRLNLAERRATHNAVERQRRETLNGRFLVSCRAI